MYGRCRRVYKLMNANGGVKEIQEFDNTDTDTDITKST